MFTSKKIRVYICLMIIMFILYFIFSNNYVFFIIKKNSSFKKLVLVMFIHNNNYYINSHEVQLLQVFKLVNYNKHKSMIIKIDVIVVDFNSH